MRLPIFPSRILPGDLLHNFPVLSLIFVNVITIILAVLENWDIATVLFVYWLQSIIIGLFTVILLLTSGIKSGGLPNRDIASATPEAQIQAPETSWVARAGLAGFFCIHYGIFHYAYYDFIVASGIFGQVNFSDPGIYISGCLFFANHLYSFLYHWNDHIKETGNFGADFFTPYKRILPMHMTIIFGSLVMLVLEIFGISSTMPVLILFLVLKTCADLSAHNEKYFTEINPSTAENSS